MPSSPSAVSLAVAVVSLASRTITRKRDQGETKFGEAAATWPARWPSQWQVEPLEPTTTLPTAKQAASLAILRLQAPMWHKVATWASDLLTTEDLPKA